MRTPGNYSSRLRAGLLSSVPLALLWAGCQYDIDKIYKHQADDAGQAGDGDIIDEVPQNLIDLWSDDQLSMDCKACARSACLDVSDTCKGDDECLALTRCVAKAVNPAEQNNCRAQHTAWLREDIQGRDVGGPYHTCVFLNSCAVECESRKDMGCASSGYGWPKANGSNVALHLQLLEGQGGTKPVPDVRVRACQPENTGECQPLSEWSTSNEKGVVDLEVGLTLGVFLGYLELEGGGLYPTLLQFGWPVARDLTTRVTVVSDMNARFLVNSVTPPVATPAQITMARGFFQARAFTCGGIPASGVQFACDEADKYVQNWYTPNVQIFPDFTRTSTSELGAGGITAVVPGLRRFSASYDDEVISRFLAPARMGYMTVVFVLPGGTL
jgi:hypothetical protein